MITQQNEEHTIFIIRHGERADNCPIESPLVEIQSDPHLTEEGRQQAILAGKELKILFEKGYQKGYISTPNPQIVLVSSPFLRCIQTSNGILSVFEPDNIYHNTITLDPGFSEYLSTEYFTEDPMGALFVKTKEKDGIGLTERLEVCEALMNSRETETPKFPEEYETFQERVCDHYTRLASDFTANMNKDKDKVLIIVTHGLVVKAILEYHSQKFNMTVGYTAITLILSENVEQGKGKVVKKASLKHLYEAETQQKKPIL
jgi:broad specificity phosphatase PhoE